MPNLGFSFQPGAQDVHVGGGGPAPGTAPQGPAKILSLRLPRNLGQSPTVARQLLTAPGAGGSPDLNAIIAALMRTAQPPMNAMGQMAPTIPQGQAPQFHAGAALQAPQTHAFGGGQPSGQAPPPRFVLGDDPNAGNRGPGIPAAPFTPDSPFRVGGSLGDAPGPGFNDQPIDLTNTPFLGSNLGGTLAGALSDKYDSLF